MPDEKMEVVSLADQAHLTISELVRRLVTGRQLPDAHRHVAVRELVQINADQARLGNLLRMALSDEDFRPPEGMRLETVLNDIRTAQTALKAKIEEL